MTERGVFAEFVGVLEFVFPELGFGAGEAALEPLGTDQGIDEAALAGVGGPVLFVVGGGEGFECGGVFAANDLRLGVDAGLERVHAGDGFALGRARAGGFPGVPAVGVDLLERGHNQCYSDPMVAGRGARLRNCPGQMVEIAGANLLRNA